MTGGLFLLGWFATLWFEPESAPYHYQLTKEGPSAEFSKMDLETWPELKVSQYKVQVDGIDKPVAEFVTAEQEPGKPILIHWKNTSGETLYNLDRKPSELSQLAIAIGRHAPKDALLLA